MAERVGIPAARDSRGTLHGRAAIDRVPPPYEGYKPLRCGSCSTAVVAVPSYPRRTSGGVTQVMAFYRLTSNGEHDPGCQYDFKNRAEELIHSSRGTVVKQGDVYELRLPDPDKVELPDQLPPRGPSRPRARLRVTTSSRTLVPALGSAARIVRLLREFDDDPDAASRFRVRYAGQKIPWHQFCLSTTQISDIAAQLNQSQSHRHPLALHGVVQTTGTTPSGDTFYLRDDQETDIHTTSGRRRLRVVVRSRHEDAFINIHPGQRWLGYGHWREWHATNGQTTEIQLWINGSWSLSTWTE